MDKCLDEAKNVTPLLEIVNRKIDAVCEATKLYGPRLAPEFSGFRLLDPNEVRLSAVLVNLLNPEGNHAQGELYLRAFLAHFLRQHKDDDLTGVSVVPELTIKNRRRIDLVAEAKTFVIGFENKPWAGDQREQVSDYLAHLNSGQYSELKAKILFYLSRDGTDPTETSIKEGQREAAKTNGNLRVVAYMELVPWLQECEKNTLAPNVRQFIAEYISYIEYQFGGVTNMAEQDEIVESCLGSSDHIEATFKIANALPQLKVRLLDMLSDQIGRKLGSSWKVESSFDKSFAFGQRLTIKLHESQKYIFAFAFENGVLDWGIERFDRSSPQENFSGLAQKYTKALHAFYMEQGHTTFLCYAHFDKPALNWKTSPKPWQEILDGDTLATKMAKQIKDLHQRLHEENLLEALM